MRVMRIFADDRGMARVEWRLVPLAPDASGRPTSPRFPAREVFFRATPKEHARGKHTAPQRQLIVVVGGIGEVVLDDGSRHRFGPGDMLFAEDTSGHGHETHVVEGIRGFVHVPVPDSFDVTAWPLAGA
jgi:hypothetical protein